MRARTPVPPGPPPRGFRWPDEDPRGPLAPAPAPDTTERGPGGHHTVTVFVGIVALVVGIAIGFQLGRDAGDDRTAASPATTTTAAPAVTPTGPTTTAPPGASSLGPLGTVGNPIPVGQSWILGFWQLQVLSADRDATAEVLAASSRNPDPPEGHVDVLVSVELTLTERDIFVLASELALWLEDADGQQFRGDLGACGPDVPDAFVENGVLEPDQTVTGNFCFQVPTELVDDLVIGTEGVGDTTVYFELPA